MTDEQKKADAFIQIYLAAMKHYQELVGTLKCAS
jgi:hypothetical protein